jgi:tetratricopeptide (TPR) repeat protein
MKKATKLSPNTIYAMTIAFFAVAVCFIIYKYSEDRKKESFVIYKIKERSGPLSKTAEWENVRHNANFLTESIKKNPNDVKLKVSLSSLFIQEARITGDYTYYDKAAMKYVDDVLRIDSNNFDALTLKALLYLSQHHFAEGIAFAEKAKTINPYSAFVYGILVDGNVEMGNYEKAVQTSDKMVSIRPDLRSYSRIAYLREIHGDYAGAIEAMKMAVEAGAPGDETTEWCRVQLGQLFENTGDVQGAEMQYILSTEERPGYPPALAGLSRISIVKKEYAKALNYLQQGDLSSSSTQFKDQMIDLYTLMGSKKEADKMSGIMIDEMTNLSKMGENDQTIGHYADRELAMAYLKINDYENALKHALIEYNRRPLNIDVNETVAWVYYNKGEFQKALPYLKTALRTNSKNPSLLCRAALIYSKTGNKDSARDIINAVLSKNPVIPDQLEKASKAALTVL